MTTIREDIEAVMKTHLLGAVVVASNTEVYNKVTEALAKLYERPWVNRDADEPLQATAAPDKTAN